MSFIPALPETRPLRLAIIGMGGYAGAHHLAALELEQEGVLQVIATCDPMARIFAPQMEEWRFVDRGVRVFPDFLVMLDHCAGDLDGVVIPTPIPLHAEMHRACVERGLSVYLEKPPTLDPVELEAMIALDQSSVALTNVGFNYIIQPERQALKRRLLAGEFGELQEVRFLGEWSRSSAYFQRNNWAGRLLGPDGRLLLDSCFGNAMAHYVHNSLFWAGTDAQRDWAVPAEVRAKLFRAHRIEGPDSVFVECMATNGVRLRFAMTHVSPPDYSHGEEIHCANAILRFVVGSHFEISWRDGRLERYPLPEFHEVKENQRAFGEYLRGEIERPPTTLAESRPFVHLNAMMYLSAGSVEDFPAALVQTSDSDDGSSRNIVVNGLSESLRKFLDDGLWPEWDSSAGAPPRTSVPGEIPLLLQTLRKPDSTI